ncbi:glutathione S-transferase U17-like [Apium graveolens]|uniref:glutathione S-transferase U17-like n=1 Tax=Apium graveolens TaxID=4045 RepID=UPI003D797017
MVSGGVKLLGNTCSPYVNRVLIALKLKAIDFEFLEENLSSKSDHLMRCNPVHKKVPVLIHDNKIICESLIIVQYIDHVWKDNGYSILPSDPHDRAVTDFWVAYFDVKLVPILKKLYIVQGEDKIAVKQRIDKGMKVLEEAFAKCSKEKAYFGGDTIGYIDIAVGGCLGWIKAMEKLSGLELIEEAKTPKLAQWALRFMSNDAVKNVFPENGK